MSSIRQNGLSLKNVLYLKNDRLPMHFLQFHTKIDGKMLSLCQERHINPPEFINEKHIDKRFVCRQLLFIASSFSLDISYTLLHLSQVCYQHIAQNSQNNKMPSNHTETVSCLKDPANLSLKCPTLDNTPSYIKWVPKLFHTARFELSVQSKGLESNP